ncbi:MAG: hypothetical protein RLZZ74_3422 [Cyanobacteriota bacterium]|jgi:hypothetical protein
MKFDLDQAMTALQSVCRQYKGTADEHEYLKVVLNQIYQIAKGEHSPNLKPVMVPDPEG